MKKKTLRLTATLLSVAMCAALSGCSIDFGALLLVKKAYDAILDVKSVRLSATVEASGLSGTESVSLSAAAEGECVVEPLAATMTADFDLGPQGVYEVPFYLMEDDDGVMSLYVGAQAAGVRIWFKKVLDASIDAFSNSALVVLRYMKECTEPISRGSETEIRGKMAEPISVVIPGESLMQSDEKGQAITGEHPIKNLRVTVWLDEETNLPLRVESDIAELVQYYLERMDVAVLPALTVEHMYASVDIYDYNGAESVTLPEAAVSAVEVEPSSIEIAMNPTGQDKPESSPDAEK